MTSDAHLFINRELSWLAFNERVLAEARNSRLPVYARLRFLGISASNLDEFFMVRVAGLKQQLQSGVTDVPPDGMLPSEQLLAISARVRALVAEQDHIWRNELQPELARRGVHLLTASDLNKEQLEAAHRRFHRDIFPALTPIALDPGHPFPHLRSGSLNIALKLRRNGKGKRRNLPRILHAVVQVPSVLPRLVPVPGEGVARFVSLGHLIGKFAEDLFPGFELSEYAGFRVTRNWDLNVDEDEAEDLLSAVQEELRRQDRGAAVRLELSTHASTELEHLLCESLNLSNDDVHRIEGLLQPSDLNILGDVDLRPELHLEPATPVVPPALKEAESLFEVIRHEDVLLHHPYESFDPVVRFIEEAAEDPKVLAIKQTFYRTSGNSPFVRALERAAENGKQVAALVEIKARFDEANNIAWARRLEQSGVHVVYGLIGLKTHCKATLVVRKEETGIRRYVHLSTGNYNPQTARLYTDFSLFTARRDIAEDVTSLFNMLTGLTDAPRWKKLAVAPIDLEKKILSLVQREREKAKAGKRGRIRAKMNSLVDPVVIRALYDASQAGVQIDLIIRGICCLRPGVAGVSENIRVISIVDRFLEHSRVFSFGEDDDLVVYLSSADWMPRNLRRRIETLFPVEDEVLAARVVRETFDFGLADSLNASFLLPQGAYERVKDAKRPFRSQMACIENARLLSARVAEAIPSFQPFPVVNFPSGLDET